ncbi:MAG: undecaprenyldiphospho-muramoylpentapeptide beta-N-acetylglucosaminyltransferase [Candidatus Aminicenantes bacterium]|nr:undecaprenyldiphospho-muramoylpentapeptide beta-N-acetylglucosaminyltransferase [Candidatus Aminicenantes bacterium]
MRPRRVIISGGGTAGHIFPALEVGRKLKEEDSMLHLVFVGSSRKLEKNIMDKHNVDFIPLKIEGLKGMGIKTIRSLALLPSSFIKSLFILLRIKPDLVIGVGGYSSGPIVLLSSLLRIPTLIMEQNSRPGFTNRLLRRWANKAAVSFKSSVAFFKGKAVLTGNPVREEFYSLASKPRNSRLSLLVFGGSQGSHFLNTGIVRCLPLIHKAKNNLIIYHQTGEKDFDWIKLTYQKLGFKEATVAPFFYDMPNYFRKADLIISRAGATTVAELLAARKASILIPFAQAADNHQEKNARELESLEGAEVITERKFTPEILSEKILSYSSHKDRITRMENSLERIRTEKAAGKISRLCFELIEAGHKEKQR